MANLTQVSGVRTKDVAGIRRRNILLYTGPAAYAAAGDPFAPTEAGLVVIECINSISGAWDGGANIRWLVYDYVNKVMHWFSAAGTEIGAGVNLSTYTVRLEVVGR